MAHPYFTGETTITPSADWPDGTGFEIDDSSSHAGDDFAGWHAFRDPVADPNSGYAWLSDPWHSTIDEWVSITYPEPVLLQRYVLPARIGDNYHPRRWQMQGSNDGGGTWTDIGSLQIPNPVWVGEQVTEIDVSFNTIKYASYRVLCPYIDEGQTLPGHRSIRYIQLFTAVPFPPPPPP